MFTAKDILFSMLLVVSSILSYIVYLNTNLSILIKSLIIFNIVLLFVFYIYLTYKDYKRKINIV